MTQMTIAGGARWGWLGTLALAVTLLTVTVLGAWQRGAARADVRKAAPQRSFQSGGARSTVVLQEIATTLRRIDARLERIDRAAALVLSAAQAQPAPQPTRQSTRGR